LAQLLKHSVAQVLTIIYLYFTSPKVLWADNMTLFSTQKI